MKKFKSILFLSLGLLCALSFSSCGDDDDDDVIGSIGGYTEGVHKIVIEVSGDASVQQDAVFAGATSTGVANLYNEGGQSMGQTYHFSSTVGKTKKIVCYTANNGMYLACTYQLNNMETGGTQNVSISIKAYINDKLVNSLSQNVVLSDSGQNSFKSFTLGTSK